MSRKWSSVVALGVAIAQVALLACGSSAAEASTASTAQQRTAFERAIARYARIESSTTPAEVRSQMRATEATIEPCLSVFKNLYEKETSLPLADHGLAATVDTILGTGAQDRGEHWNAVASLPAIQAGLVLDANGNANAAKRDSAGDVAATRIEICRVIERWSGQHYAWADKPLIYLTLTETPGLSPYVATGSKVSATTYRSWGKRTATQLFDELTKGSAGYNKLNAVAYKQFVGWLKQQGVYQLMAPQDRELVKFEG